MSPALPILLHAAATLAMTGLIWFVQLVHYPLFAFAARGDFAAFAAAHQRRTTWVVAPLMLLELATAAALLLPGAGVATAPALGGAALLAVIWLTTAFVSVPLHARLAAGFDPTVAARLVASNWVRTTAWSARAVVALWLVHDARSGG